MSEYLQKEEKKVREGQAILYQIYVLLCGLQKDI